MVYSGYRKYAIPGLISAGTILGKQYLRGLGTRLSARKGSTGISKVGKVQGKIVSTRIRRAPIHREKRYHDNAEANFYMGTTGNLNQINKISTGDNDYHRNGSSIMMGGVTLRGFYIGGTSQGLPTIGRLMVVYDKQPRGALPTLTDILVSATPVSLINGNHADRFTILFDKLYSVAGDGDTLSGAHPAGTIQEYIRVNLPAVWESLNTDGDISDVLKGGLYIVQIGSGPAADGEEAGRFRLATRVHFVDEP